MPSKVFLLLALAARASAFASLPKAPAEESIGARMSYTAFTSLATLGANVRVFSRHVIKT